MNKQRHTFPLGDSVIAYSLFSHSSSSQPSSDKPVRRIVLLHGAGVAGELTWSFIAHYLKHWDEVLVPDLYGMGDSYFDTSDKQPFSIDDICQGLFSLLRHLSWWRFDLVGYSLGGLVALELNHQAAMELNDEHQPDFLIAKMCLIEPALFSDSSLSSALAFRQSFVPLAENIQAEPDNEAHFVQFLDLVSPHRMRQPKADKIAIQRLQSRPYGFANALFAVSNYAQTLDEYSLQQLLAAVPVGVGIVGGLSGEGLLLAQQKIQSVQPHWNIEVLQNMDHGLVYVRPKQVAQLIDQYLF